MNFILKYEFEVLYTSFSLQEATYVSEPTVPDYYSIYVAALQTERTK